MIYLAGYILACFLTISGLAWVLTSVHKRSALHVKVAIPKFPPSIRSHALISFSVILPFSALAYLFLILAATKMTESQGDSAKTFIDWALRILPTGSFLLGYFYFKKMVGS